MYFSWAKARWPLSVALTCLALPLWAATPPLTLQQAVTTATQNDLWLQQNRQQQQALQAQSIAAGTLPDPQLSLGLANLPTDGFDFDQEEMTQLKIGLSQRIPRGDSLSLRRKQLRELSEQHPLQRYNRQARVTAQVSELWLNAYRAQESIALINTDKVLFEQLVDVAETNYTVAGGQVRQQDLVRAQLELTRLEDRLVRLEQQQVAAKQRLYEWLPLELVIRPLPVTLPAQANAELADSQDEQTLLAQLNRHPLILAKDKKIASASTGISLAEQNFRPQWQVNASYGFRDDRQTGESRADFFSVGLSVDLPLFTDNKQDQQRKAAVASSESVKTEKRLLQQQMLAKLTVIQNQRATLHSRAQLYQSQLLPQMRAQAEAALNAYTNDIGDFAEVMRARIAELNAKIDALNILVDQHILIAQQNYYLAGAVSKEQ